MERYKMIIAEFNKRKFNPSFNRLKQSVTILKDFGSNRISFVREIAERVVGQK